MVTISTARRILPLTFAALAAACYQPDAPPTVATQAATATTPEYYGTLEPFAEHAVYFVVTDRFVDGDPDNNQREQGAPDPARMTFDRPITDLEGRSGNIGYLGGDFRGIVDHADYITEMGFGAVWITPIVENPDEAFLGGNRLGEGFFADRGKTGYHGYWGVNFYRVDEHLESPGLAFADLTRTLKAHGLVTVLDIVANHGSPSYTMPVDQPGYGEIYDEAGNLIADHQNLHPSELDPDNPLHRFFHREPDLAELSNVDETNPAVLDYFTGAYLKWIGQGAGAFRIDTIRHVPHPFWKKFSDRVRAEHPGFFMFGESFDYDAKKIAEHTFQENGAVSVLDFPGKQRITEVFENSGSNFAQLTDYLHLADGVYKNPYELMTFYDNHDMPRMNATDSGFINAHNWLFTSRGIPVIYYGSEIAFRAGRPEHGGNRDYFGKENVAAARQHPIRQALIEVAAIRRASPALQRGLQANLNFTGDTAAFLRVYQHDGVNQTALVLLNKGAAAAPVHVQRWLSTGTWRDAATGTEYLVSDVEREVTVEIPGHGVRVLLFDAPNNNPELATELSRLHEGARANRR